MLCWVSANARSSLVAQLNWTWAGWIYITKTSNNNNNKFTLHSLGREKIFVSHAVRPYYMLSHRYADIDRRRGSNKKILRQKTWSCVCICDLRTVSHGTDRMQSIRAVAYCSANEYCILPLLANSCRLQQLWVLLRCRYLWFMVVRKSERARSSDKTNQYAILMWPVLAT